MRLILLLGFVSFAFSEDSCTNKNASTSQLECFKQKNTETINLTTDTGAPVQLQHMTTLEDDTPLIRNQYFMDSLTHLLAERIPNRVVHAHGTGALGYFETTHDITDICKAKFLDTIGKKSSVVARFSAATSFKGATSTMREPRGFSIQIRTEEGVFALPMFNTPMFGLKDPLYFKNFVHTAKRNPQTYAINFGGLVDLILTTAPEAVFFILWFATDRGSPDGYEHMAGYPIHTYQFENEKGETNFGRFHFLPDAGIKNFTFEEAVAKTSEDPHYMTRKLYNNIASGNFPSWTVYLQVVTPKQAAKADFDIFDPTMIIPIEEYPLRPFGKLVINENPSNQFEQIELSAYCPGYVVPGILGSPDQLYEGRVISYQTATQYRMGINFRKHPINKPVNAFSSYIRDGVAPVDSNGGGSPNYYPNSFNGSKPVANIEKTKLIKVIHKEGAQNKKQIKQFLGQLDDQQTDNLITALINILSTVPLEKLLKLGVYIATISIPFTLKFGVALVKARVVSSLKDFISAITDLAGGTIDDLTQAVENPVDTVVDATKTVVDVTKSVASTVTDEVAKGAKSVLSFFSKIK